jgi:arsenite transporter
MHAARPFAFAARHGKIVLVLGLLAGILLPGLADAMRPWIGWMVAGLLFLAALRVGPRQAIGALRDIGTAAGLALLFQTILPLAAIAVVAATGWIGSAIATGLILMLAASPVSGSPHFTVMTGNNPAPALRQLVLGTALLPLTVIPVFWLMPGFGKPSAVLAAAGGLMLLILAAGGLAFLIRGSILREPTPAALQVIDGLSAIAMAIVVVGLMSAVGPALVDAPAELAATLAIAFAANILLQVAAGGAASKAGARNSAAAIGIVCGDRNIALFLAVLPPAVSEPVLLFIGCYQIPMYLTPVVMSGFYRRVGPKPVSQRQPVKNRHTL